MRAVVQRVTSARVWIEGVVCGSIGQGLLIYLGVGGSDDDAALGYMVEKITGLRIFADDAGKMNRSVLEVGGGVLVVSQFTLYGDVRRGRRPAFDQAMEPEGARRTYERFVEAVRERGLVTETGEFKAHMTVDAQVDGPITILIDSSRLF